MLDSPEHPMRHGFLFLDFDGVCHPEGCLSARLFEKLPNIEAFLREHPNIDVVISSSWRSFRSLSEMRKHFSPDIAPRVVGVTPQSPRNLTTGMTSAVPKVRELECLQWLQACNAPSSPWVAIDDQPGLFTTGCANLVVTSSHRGFEREDLPRLSATWKGQCQLSP